MRDAFALDPYRHASTCSSAVSRGAVIFEPRVPGSEGGAAPRRCDRRSGTCAPHHHRDDRTASLEFKQLRRHFKRRESYLVLTEPVPAPVRKQLVSRDTTFSDTKMPHHRLRWTPDDRILVGGAEQDETPEKKRAGVLIQRTGQLMYELLTMFPIISGLMPEYGWELISGETADGLMYIGPHRNYPRHLFALGSGVIP